MNDKKSPNNIYRLCVFIIFGLTSGSVLQAQILGNFSEEEQYYGEDVGSDIGSYKTTITTNTDGAITQETREGIMASDGKEVDISELDNVSENNSNSSKTERKISSSKNEEDNVSQEEYTGVYRDRQIIPNIMAIYCKLKAEDMIKNMSLMDDCIKKYVRAINNKNAIEKAQGIKDFNMLKYNLLADTTATSIAKTESIASYENTMNKYAKASAKQATKFDNEEGLIQTITFSTDVINGMRELYAEDLKYKAILGIADIDPSVLSDIAERENSDNTVNIGKTDASYTNVTAQTITE